MTGSGSGDFSRPPGIGGPLTICVLGRTRTSRPSTPTVVVRPFSGARSERHYGVVHDSSASIETTSVFSTNRAMARRSRSVTA